MTHLSHVNDVDVIERASDITHVFLFSSEQMIELIKQELTTGAHASEVQYGVSSVSEYAPFGPRSKASDSDLVLTVSVKIPYWDSYKIQDAMDVEIAHRKVEYASNRLAELEVQKAALEQTRLDMEATIAKEREALEKERLMLLADSK